MFAWQTNRTRATASEGVGVGAGVAPVETGVSDMGRLCLRAGSRPRADGKFRLPPDASIVMVAPTYCGDCSAGVPAANETAGESDDTDTGGSDGPTESETAE